MTAITECARYYRMMNFRPAAEWLAKEEDQKQLAKATIKGQTHTLQEEQILKHQCLSQKKTKSAIPLTNFFKPSSAMNKFVNNPVNSPTNICVDSPVHSPTDSRVNSPLNSLHSDHMAAADELKNNEENIKLNEEHTDSNLSFSDTNSSSESEFSENDVEIAE